MYRRRHSEAGRPAGRLCRALVVTSHPYFAGKEYEEALGNGEVPAPYIDVQSRTLGNMSKTMTVSQARAALPEILDRVEAGEEVTITRHGKPAAVVVRPDALRTRRAEAAFATAALVREGLAQGRARPLSARPAITEARAEELIADVQASRNRT